MLSIPILSIAVAIGLIPALASWVLGIIDTALQAGGTTLGEVYIKGNNTGSHTIKSFEDQRFFISGVISMSQGFVVSSIVLAAMTGFIIEKAFVHAAYWALCGMVLSCIGIIHAYELTPQGVKSVYGYLAALPRAPSAHARGANSGAARMRMRVCSRCSPKLA